jgi:hypothetical protein
MKSLLEVCIVGSLLVSTAGAQEPARPAPRKGVSVQMPVANHAVAMHAADEEQATVVAITAEGKLFVGVEPAGATSLSNLRAQTIYVKADSRVPFQTVLTVLDALRGKSVVLLSASPATAELAKIIPPYGINLTVSK